MTNSEHISIPFHQNHQQGIQYVTCYKHHFAVIRNSTLSILGKSDKQLRPCEIFLLNVDKIFTFRMGAARQTESGDGPDLSSRGIR
jgi:hypothetical protein